MFNIASNGIITVNRGDSFEFLVPLNIGSSINVIDYKLQNTDAVYIGIMEPNQPFEVAIVRKRLTTQDLNESGGLIARFYPEDTVCLLPGKYYYQIKLETEVIDSRTNTIRKNVKTIVDKTLFYVQE